MAMLIRQRWPSLDKIPGDLSTGSRFCQQFTLLSRVSLLLDVFKRGFDDCEEYVHSNDMSTCWAVGIQIHGLR